MSDLILQCSNLCKSYRDGKHKVEVLKGIDLSLKTAETMAIVGASGSGKSTLLHLLGGLDKITDGKITWGGQDIASLSETKRCALRNHHLGFVYQFHHLLPEFNAFENVAMPLLIGNQDPKTAEKEAKSLLAQVGLGGRVTHKVGELSGGERQRVALARALVTKPRCVLADEPTGNLDSQTAEQMLALMLNLQEKLGISFIVVTHDRLLAKRLQRSYVLRDGMLENIAENL